MKDEKDSMSTKIIPSVLFPTCPRFLDFFIPIFPRIKWEQPLPATSYQQVSNTESAGRWRILQALQSTHALQRVRGGDEYYKHYNQRTHYKWVCRSVAATGQRSQFIIGALRSVRHFNIMMSSNAVRTPACVSGLCPVARRGLQRLAFSKRLTSHSHVEQTTSNVLQEQSSVKVASATLAQQHGTHYHLICEQ